MCLSLCLCFSSQVLGLKAYAAMPRLAFFLACLFYVHDCSACLMPEVVGSFLNWSSSGGELPHGCWELNPGALNL